MIPVVNNKVVLFNNKAVDFDMPLTPLEFVFTTASDAKFPQTGNFLDFDFSKASQIVVDWGDGNIVPYNTAALDLERPAYLTFKNVGSIDAYTHNYQYDEAGTYTIKITVLREVRSRLRSLIVGITVPLQSFNWNIGQFSQLRSLLLYTNVWTAFYFSKILGAVSLKNFAFYPLDGVTPIEILSSKLESIDYTTTYAQGQSFTLTNLDKYYKLRRVKEIILNPLIDNMNGSGKALPDEFEDIADTLETLRLTGTPTQFTKIPPIINTRSSLKVLSASGGFDTYGEFSGLVSLTQLLLRSSYLPDGCPEWLGSLEYIKLISISGFGGGGNPEAVNFDSSYFLETIYDLLTPLASMTGDSSMPFRSIFLELMGNDYNGIYQAPTGYVLGVSNGTPTSAKERIYVLVNQYGWGVPIA